MELCLVRCSVVFVRDRIVVLEDVYRILPFLLAFSQV
jgi:hypothetical protein